MPQLDPLRARIQLDGGAQAASSLRLLATQITKTRVGLLSLGTATAAAGAAMAAVAINAAIDFESAMAGVQKTTGATDEELESLGEQFRDLSKEIPVAASELGRLGQVAGQLGIKQKDIAAFVETTAKLGAAVDDLSPEQAATQLARFANIAGTAAADFENLASSLVALGNTTATTEGEILDLSLRIAESGTRIGLTEGQIFGFAASLRAVGVEAQAGGTALARAFDAMQDAVLSGSNQLEVFATVADQTVAEFKQSFETDAAGAVQAFLAGLKTMITNGESVTKVLQAVNLQTVRTRRALLGASAASDKLNETVQRGNDEFVKGVALQNEASIRFATTASKLKILTNNFNSLFIEIGTNLLPTFNKLLVVLLNVARAMDQVFGDAGARATEARIAAVDLFNDLQARGMIGTQAVERLVAQVVNLTREMDKATQAQFLTTLARDFEKFSGTASDAAAMINKLGDAFKKAASSNEEAAGATGELSQETTDLLAAIDALFAGTEKSAGSMDKAAQATDRFRSAGEQLISQVIDQLANRSLPGLNEAVDNAVRGYGELNLEIQQTTTFAERFGVTAGSTADETGDLSNEMDRAARAGVDFANGMGLIDDSMARTLDSMINLTSATFDLVDALGSIAGGAATGGIVGAITGIAGALVGLIGGLFGKGENDKFRENAEIILTLLAEQDDLLQEIANSLEDDVLAGLERLAALDLGDKIDSDEAEALVRQMEALGIGFTDLKELAQKFGLDVSELIKVLITGEGDRKLAAEQWIALNEAITLLPDPLREAADAADEAAKAIEDAANQIRDALSELGEELGDIRFDTEVFALTLQQQFGRVIEEVFKALADSGDPALQGAADSLKSLLGLDLTTQGGRESALSAIQAFVTAMGDDVPSAIKSAVRELLSLIGDFESEAAAAAQPVRQIDPFAKDRRILEHQRRTLEETIARVNAGLPQAGIEARQSVSITGVQANELLSVTRTNAYDNRLNRLSNERSEAALMMIAHAVGGDLLVQRISQQLGTQLTDQLARQGVAA